MNKRNYTAEFKTKIVLEVLKEDQRIGEIASKYDINPNLIRTWRKEFLGKAPSLFEDSRISKETAQREKQLEIEKAEMLKTIGQLTLERDFLKKKSIQVFGPDYEKKFTR